MKSLISTALLLLVFSSIAHAGSITYTFEGGAGTVTNVNLGLNPPAVYPIIPVNLPEFPNLVLPGDPPPPNSNGYYDTGGLAIFANYEVTPTSITLLDSPDPYAEILVEAFYPYGQPHVVFQQIWSGAGTVIATDPVSSIPEPSSFLLLALGVTCAYTAIRKRKLHLSKKGKGEPRNQHGTSRCSEITPWESCP